MTLGERLLFTGPMLLAALIALVYAGIDIWREQRDKTKD